MKRWPVLAVILFASACTNGGGESATTTSISTTTAASATSTTPSTTTLPEAGPCNSVDAPEATIDVDGDGATDNVYLSQRDDGGHDLVVCGNALDTSIDIGGENKPPSFAGGFDIDGNGTQELFYSGTAGRGVIFFATTLADGELEPLDYSWPVILESGDAETPITGTSFVCNNNEMMVTEFQPAGDEVLVTPTLVTLADGQISGAGSDSFDWPADRAYSLWQAFNGCFEPASEPLVPTISGWVDPSGLGVATGVDVMLLTDDGGATWVDISPLQRPSWHRVVSAQFLDPDTGYAIVNDAGMQSQLVATLDGGKSWTVVYEFPPLHHAGATRTIQFLNRDVGLMYHFDPAATECAVLEQTTDGGETWARQTECLPSSGTVSFDKDGLGWLGGQAFLANADGDSLYYSSDYGQTWRDARAELPEGRDPTRAVYGLPVVFRDRGLLAVALHDEQTVDIAVYETNASGIPGSLLTVIPTTTDAEKPRSPLIVFVSETTWWAASATNEITVASVTTDGGATWRTTDSIVPPATVNTLQAVDDDTAWLTTDEGLFITQDATRWYQVVSGDVSGITLRAAS